jgi:catalase
MSMPSLKSSQDAVARARAVISRLFALELNAGRTHSMNTDRSDGRIIVSDCHLPDGIVVDAEAGQWIDQPNLNEPPLALAGAAANWDHRVDYQQPGDLFRKLAPVQQQMLCDNTARQVGAAARHIQKPRVANDVKASPAYGGVAKSLGIDLKSSMIAAE